MANRAQTKKWTFTSFEAQEPEFSATSMSYMVYQPEICPQTQRRHWQGYVVMIGKKRFTEIKGYLPPGAHVEAAKGSHAENIAYCTKHESRCPDEVSTEHGQRPVESITNRWEALRLQIKNPAISIDEILENNIELAIKNGSNVIATILRLRPAIPQRRMLCLCLYGATGVGKSRWVYTTYKASDIFMKDDSAFWDGYNNQKVIVFNEFNGQHKHPLVFNVCDTYPMRVPVKGSTVQLLHNTVVFLSNKAPHHWWAEERRLHPDIGAAMNRRVPPSNEQFLMAGQRPIPLADWQGLHYMEIDEDIQRINAPEIVE